jgi:hypothetical protein
LRRNGVMLGIAAAAMAATGAITLAFGQGPGAGRGYEYSGMPPQSQPERQAIEDLCPAEPPCHIVEVDSDSLPAAGGERPGESLLRDGRRPHACPEAADAFAASGDPVHAWIGRCPTPAETQTLVSSQNGSPQFEAQFEDGGE